MNKTISTEGETLKSALLLASEQLGVAFEQVRYSFDKEHFRNSLGRSKAVATIKIQAWIATEEEIKEEEKKKEEKNSLKTQSAVQQKIHPVAEKAKLWLSGLMEYMSIPVSIEYTVKDDEHIILLLNSEKGGRIVGRKGSSLQQFKHLLNEVMNNDELCSDKTWNFSIDVLKDEASKDRSDRDRRKRRDDSSRRKRLGDQDISKIKRLAKKLAGQVLDQKQSVVIGKVFNNFERRIIHQTITEIDGVDTESFDDDGVRKIRLIYLSEDLITEDETE